MLEIFPWFVSGLGWDKHKQIILNCPDCRRNWREVVNSGKDITVTDKFIMYSNPLYHPCKAHSKLGRKRRFGSGITCRRWKKLAGHDKGQHKEHYKNPKH